MKRTVLLLAALSVAAMLAAEWMRAPGWILAFGIGLAAAAALYTVRGGTLGLPDAVAWLGSFAAMLLALAAAVGTRELRRIERSWPVVREGAVTAASRLLGGELDAAADLARSLAERAAAVATGEGAEAFPALERLVQGSGPSHGVVVFDGQGRPLAWAGIQRTALTAAGAELSVVTTPFYLWLVARRQTTTGTAASVVMLARGDDVPRVGTALTDRFVQRTGVGLRLLPAGAMPNSVDPVAVLSYVPAGTQDTLFAVQPVPPEQDAAYGSRVRAARQVVALLAVVVLLLAGSAGIRVGSAWATLPLIAAAGAVARAPLHATFGDGSIFSPFTYIQPLLGPFSASVGALLLTGIVLFVSACALWHRGLPSTWPGRVVAVFVTLLAPYLLQRLARGVAPPAGGVTTVQWATWQIALMVAASALVISPRPWCADG